MRRPKRVANVGQTLDGHDRAGGRAGSWQRRAGPSRRLLHGFARDARACRPSATACATSSGSSIRRFVTGGRWSSPTSGCASAIRGRSCEPRTRSTSRSAGGRSGTTTRRPNTGCGGCPTQLVKGVAVRHARARVTGWRPPICSACGRPRRPSRSTSTRSMSATTTAPSTKRSRRRRSRKCSIPMTSLTAGKQLRLAQQYFFVSCSLQDMIRLHLMRGKPLDEFDAYWAAQLNDTHPSIAVAELMRLLVDEHLMDWDQAWAITQRTCGYTNHTLLAEALEKWPLPMFKALLPRHLEIIQEINRRFLDEVRCALSGRRGARSARVAHRRSRRAVRPHGAPRVGRQPRDQRRGGAPFGAAQADGAARLLPAVAREVLQRDQRRDAPALDGAQQSRPRRAHHPPHRRPLDRATSTRSWRASSRSPPTRLPARMAGGQGRQQTDAWPRSSRTVPGSWSIPTRCSTCRSSDSTNTSASISTPCISSRCTTGCSATRRRGPCLAR